MWFLFVTWQVLARRSPGGEYQTRRLRISSQASSPRFVTSPQLPSPRTQFEVRFYIWYHAPGFKLLELSTGD
jgi:hypothetical protein